jgi:recombinational DNA repair protein RecR
MESWYPMSNSAVPQPVTRLIDALARLPGVGPKTASRLTYFLLRAPDELSNELAEAVGQMKALTQLCSVCYNITVDDPCPVCSDPNRDQDLIAVVEEPLDVLALERTAVYHPTARASEAHEPDPLPQKHAAADAEGARSSGQARPGSDIHTPRAAATARTQAIERAAKLPGLRPYSAARKTFNRSSGTALRTASSMPDIQPTYTWPSTSGSTFRTAARHDADGEREPEKPTTEAAESIVRMSGMT